VLLAAHPQSPINYQANCYPFRQDSNWLYYIGLNEPDMMALLDIQGGEAWLFGEDLSMDDFIWTGSRPSLEEMAAATGAWKSLPIDKLGPTLNTLLGKRLSSGSIENLHIPHSCRSETQDRLEELLDIPRKALKACNSDALVRSIIAMREIKEPREIAEIEKAVDLTVLMHKSLVSALKPGWTEAEAAAWVRHEAERRGCSLSFPCIATLSGEILHNHVSKAVCDEKSLFLLDAGAEVPSGYAGDLTTTFPVGPSFSPRQADIYSLLLSIFEGAVAVIKPDVRFSFVHRMACLHLSRGLKELGIMKGDPEEAVEEGAHALFFPHGIGHMIGLDVHDMELLGEDKVGYSSQPRSSQFGLSALRLAKPLKPGMVHSVEPGIYFIPALIDKWEAESLHTSFIDYGQLRSWKHSGGMRIEEDWLVMEKSARRLGSHLDKSLKAIENARSRP